MKTKISEHKKTIETRLTEYINKLFEQEELWINVNRIIHKSNEFKDINNLSEFLCLELKKLTGVDVCFLCLWDNATNGLKIFSATEKMYSEDINLLKKILTENKHKPYNNLLNKVYEIMHDLSDKSHIFPLYRENYFFIIVLVHADTPLCTNSILPIIEIICDNYKHAVSQILLYKQLTEANRHKTEFIANVTHEFKTPLNAIIGFAELLNIQNFSKDKTRHFISNIVINARHMLQLIENILDVSRVELNRLELVYETTETKELIEDTIKILDSMIIAKNVQLTSTLADITAELDKTRFKQVIYNLLNNAIKYTDNCGYIKLLSYIQDNNFYFEIENSGEPIKTALKEKIFDIFTRGSSKLLTTESGHGLGLYICKNIINLHGGKIFLDSSDKNTTTFKFFIPLKKII